MPIISFNSQVLSGFGLTPSNLSWSLSGATNTVILSSVGTGPRNIAALSAKQVRGLAFNALTNPASGTGILVSLSAATGTQFRVDRAYNNATFAVMFTDNSSALFRCLTGTFAQSLTSNDFETVSPEITRLEYLGYL